MSPASACETLGHPCPEARAGSGADVSSRGACAACADAGDCVHAFTLRFYSL